MFENNPRQVEGVMCMYIALIAYDILYASAFADMLQCAVYSMLSWQFPVFDLSFD